MAIVATHVAAVQELYVAYFGRPADVAGLDYWTNVVEAQGGSTTAVSASFATQPEYIVAFYQKTPAQIIDQIYANMFARGPSTTDGRSYWVDLLTKGTVGVSTIVADVANGAKGTDATSIENKVEAATAFTNALDLESEQAGYEGPDALALAKAWITGITTDATLTAAITPAALDAQVAAIVKAGTPFTLASALGELQTAERALDKFLADNELPAAVGTAKSEVAADLVTATTAVDTLVTTGTYNPAASAAVASALLADQQKLNSDALKAANTELANANAEAASKTGLSAAIANLRTATDASTAATKAAGATEVDLTVATNEFNTRNSETADVETLVDGTGKPVTLTANMAVVTIGDAAATPSTEVELIIVNARGNFVLASGITEADYPGITALRDALTADFYADTEAYAAAQTLDSAGKVKVIADNPVIVDRVMDAYDDTDGVTAAQKAIDDLAEAVADRAEVVALQTALNKADKAVTDLRTEFTTNGFATPAPLDLATASGTAASDIFMLGDAENVSITGFGRLGEDSLYVGNNYVLNSGELSTGNNSAMEVFFVQNGNRAEVHVETAAYGSSSDDVIVVSLVGVEVADLQLVDGIISLKAGA